MKKAIITGATGCLGRNLLNDLIEDGGWEIHVLHRKTSDLKKLADLDLILHEVDMHDLNSTLTAIPEGMDVLFHVAGNTSHWRQDAPIQWKDNVLATRNLVEACIQKRVKRMIFTSTGATIPFQSYTEELSQTIKNGYIRTKRLSELEVIKGVERGLDAVILQPIIVIGPFDYNSYSILFTDIKSGKIKKAFPGRISFCHAADVSKAHLSSYYHGKCGENYVLGGTYTSWLNFFQLIAKSVNSNPPEKIFKKSELYIGAAVMTLYSHLTGNKPQLTLDLVSLLRDGGDVPFQDKRKSKEVLGYHSRSLEIMVNDCRDWLIAEGKL